MTINDLWVILAILGFILGLNPNTTSVFIGLLASSFGKGHSRALVASVALAYIETLLVFYTIFAIATIWLVGQLASAPNKYFGLFLGVILVGCGLRAIFMSYHRFIKGHKKHLSPKLHSLTVKEVSVGSIVFASILTSIKNFSNTLLPLTGVAYILAFWSETKLWSVALTPLAMLAPLLLISLLAINNVKLSAIMKWKNDNSLTFQTWSGVVCVILGWLIWLFLSESLVIN